MSLELLLLLGSVLFFISMIVGKAGHRFGIPVLLLFLAVGMVFGQDGFGLEFENIQTAQIIGTVALSIILFSGGLDTKFRNKTSYTARYYISNRRCSANSFVYRFFHLAALWLTCPLARNWINNRTFISLNYIINRLCFSFWYTTFERNNIEKQSASDA